MNYFYYDEEFYFYLLQNYVIWHSFLEIFLFILIQHDFVSQIKIQYFYEFFMNVSKKRKFVFKCNKIKLVHYIQLNSIAEITSSSNIKTKSRFKNDMYICTYKTNVQLIAVYLFESLIYKPFLCHLLQQFTYLPLTHFIATINVLKSMQKHALNFVRLWWQQQTYARIVYFSVFCIRYA